MNSDLNFFKKNGYLVKKNLITQKKINKINKIVNEVVLKEKKENKKNELIEKTKETELYKTIIKNFPDAKLKDVNKVSGSDD